MSTGTPARSYLPPSKTTGRPLLKTGDKRPGTGSAYRNALVSYTYSAHREKPAATRRNVVAGWAFCRGE